LSIRPHWSILTYLYILPSWSIKTNGICWPTGLSHRTCLS
jgi:hypothetical protein